MSAYLDLTGGDIACPWVSVSRVVNESGQPRRDSSAIVTTSATMAAARVGPARRTAAWPRLRFHDLRHTFASHLILDLRLDVAQVSRILGHAQVSTTLNVYTHLFEQVRHSHEVRGRLAASAFAELLGVDGDDDRVITLPPPNPWGARRGSARERAAARWGLSGEESPTPR